ncbi:hypothetical protein B0H16DRAFT_1836500 [Mycena metata]|uniref:Uncharacterized protein n=1 Tax=Mycena metata TaxID=1033252 RepID=A0AAD7DW89_9AGAR|nr:hypothetical protein B0H16DRAFT_1836500 [Mycena metata]
MSMAPLSDVHPPWACLKISLFHEYMTHADGLHAWFLCPHQTIARGLRRHTLLTENKLGQGRNFQSKIIKALAKALLRPWSFKALGLGRSLPTVARERRNSGHTHGVLLPCPLTWGAESSIGDSVNVAQLKRRLEVKLQRVLLAVAFSHFDRTNLHVLLLQNDTRPQCVNLEALTIRQHAIFKAQQGTTLLTGCSTYDNSLPIRRKLDLGRRNSKLTCDFGIWRRTGTVCNTTSPSQYTPGICQAPKRFTLCTVHLFNS